LLQIHTIMKTFFVGIASFFFLLPSTSLAQYNHDIGLKVSTNEYDKFQMEYRWHPNNKWAFTGTVNFGKLYWSDQNWSSIKGDSTIAYVDQNSITKAFTVSIGALRKFHLMEHNFYYAGANIGYGGAVNDFATYRNVYLVDSTQLFFGEYFQTNVLDRTETHQRTNYHLATTRLYLGADVPIFGRFSLNVETGYRGMLAMSSQNIGIFDLQFFATGGLRFQFGGKAKNEGCFRMQQCELKEPKSRSTLN